MTRSQFEASCTLRGANFVGTPEMIIEKILYQHKIFGHSRFLMQMSVGSVPHDKLLRSIELFATKVAPVLRKELGAEPRCKLHGAIAMKREISAVKSCRVL